MAEEGEDIILTPKIGDSVQKFVLRFEHGEAVREAKWAVKDGAFHVTCWGFATPGGMIMDPLKIGVVRDKQVGIQLGCQWIAGFYLVNFTVMAGGNYRQSIG